MKTKNLSLLLLSLMLVSCGSSTTPTSDESKESASTQVASENNSEVSEASTPYTAKVVLPDNTPVSNAKVLWCTKELCNNPVKTNAEGVATNDLDDDTFYIHVEGIPAGYAYNPNIYVADSENKNVTITLIATSQAQSGNGSSATPYEISTGCYEASFESSSSQVYYNLKVSEPGNYVVESLAVDLLATKPIDPYFGYVDASGELNEDDNSGIGVNFKYVIEVSDTSLSYSIILMGLPKNNTPYPTGYYFTVTKE